MVLIRLLSTSQAFSTVGCSVNEESCLSETCVSHWLSPPKICSFTFEYIISRWERESVCDYAIVCVWGGVCVCGCVCVHVCECVCVCVPCMWFYRFCFHADLHYWTAGNSWHLGFTFQGCFPRKHIVNLKKWEEKKQKQAHPNTNGCCKEPRATARVRRAKIAHDQWTLSLWTVLAWFHWSMYSLLIWPL